MQFRTVVINDIACPAGDVPERHHKEYGHDGAENHGEQVDVHGGGRPDPAIRPFYPPVVVGA